MLLDGPVQTVNNRFDFDTFPGTKEAEFLLVIKFHSAHSVDTLFTVFML